MANKQTFGVIVGNRGFFPDHLAKTGREEIIRVLEAAGYGVVVLSPEDTKYGAVESRSDSRKCAELFDRHRHEIDGIIITLPNFGEERGQVEALRAAGLNVPVLVQATPDRADNMTIAVRRDSFCGKMSTCNNLTQYKIPYSLTTLHTEALDSPEFAKDLAWFAAVCRVVKGLRNCRVGAIGARPTAFNTVRYSEKLFEGSGIDVDTLDLSEVFGRIGRLKDSDDAVQAKLAEIKAYVSTHGITEDALVKMAKLGAVVDGWMKDNEITVTAVQCWTSMEEYFGVVPCTIMSMMSNKLQPSGCEVDVPGVVGMYALALASDSPSALLDWNNNYGDDPDKAVCFHCSNLPKHFFETARMDYQEIIAGTVGKLNTFGTIVGKVKASPMTYFRVSTTDSKGKISGYLGEGEFTSDPLETFGGAGVVKIPNLQGLLRFICENGFEHHVAANLSNVAGAVYEAGKNYLGWDLHWHK
ncbi:MAG: L-fucose/L-arabinose isomerase family protein [Bryobacterales bacterium]|nr:L-fucose/L-arabinose isomerase family protein [Bryobacterales bacterium]